MQDQNCTALQSSGFKYHSGLNFASLSLIPLNPLTGERALRALIDFTLSNARRFYSSMGNPLDRKGLRSSHDCKFHLHRIVNNDHNLHCSKKLTLQATGTLPSSLLNWNNASNVSSVVSEMRITCKRK